MYHLLLPVDSDEDRARNSAEQILSLPGRDEIHVTIFNVYPQIDVASGDGGAVDSDEWFDETDLPESVTAVQALLEGEDIDTSVRREHADPEDAIVDIADVLDVDGIVMTGRKRTPAGKAIFGSVTQKVLLQSNVPVLVTVD